MSGREIPSFKGNFLYQTGRRSASQSQLASRPLHNVRSDHRWGSGALCSEPAVGSWQFQGGYDPT